MLFAIRGKWRANSVGRTVGGSAAIHATVASSSTDLPSGPRRTTGVGLSLSSVFGGPSSAFRASATDTFSNSSDFIVNPCRYPKRRADHQPSMEQVHHAAEKSGL